jgi:hypothetical protein
MTIDVASMLNLPIIVGSHDGPGVYAIEQANGDQESLTSVTEVIKTSATPLPAAFPLLAIGLGALGLLGWRKKRKTSTSISAARS